MKNNHQIREKIWLSEETVKEIDHLVRNALATQQEHLILKNIHNEIAVAHARFTASSHAYTRHAKALGKNNDEFPIALSIEERVCLISLPGISQKTMTALGKI